MQALQKHNSHENTIQMAASRLGLYRLLGRLFRAEVDEKLITAMNQSPLCGTLIGIGLHPPENKNGSTHVLSELAEEYVRLFIGPGKHLPPYASVHKTLDGALNGSEAAAVRCFILGEGFQFSDTSHDYPDHISTEFEFMETLIEREREAMEHGDKEEAQISCSIQQDFFEQHIAPWVTLFCDRIIEASEHPFYQQLATCTREFIMLERAHCQTSTPYRL